MAERLTFKLPRVGEVRIPAERYPWLAAAAAAVVYAASLPGKIFWDSEVLIRDNVFLRSFDFVPKILTTSVMAGGGVPTNYYRPLPVLLLLCEYQLWGARPFGYHLVNVLVHAANAALVYFWVARAAEDKRAALWTALLFALHPLQAESVNYPDHIEGMLALSFGLLALLALERRGALLAAGAFACALLCKEEAAVFAPIMLGRWWMRRRERPWTDLAASAAVGAVYVGLRLTVLNFLGGSWREWGAQKGAYAALPLRLLTFGKALALDLRLFALPWGLHFDRDLAPAASWHDWTCWSGLLAAGLALGALWKKSDERGRAGLAWFGLALLPYCGLVPFNNIVAEHFLYIPSVGLLMTVVLLARRLRLPSARVSAAALAAVLVFYVGYDARLSWVWQHPAKVYWRTLRYNPGSYRAANNLGTIYFARRRFDDARELFERSVQAKPDYAVALNNLGATFEAKADTAAAAGWYQKALEADPGYVLARRNWANLLLQDRNFAEAETQLRAALQGYPEYDGAWKLLGVALYFQGRLPEARAALTRGYELAPDDSTRAKLVQLDALLSSRPVPAGVAAPSR